MELPVKKTIRPDGSLDPIEDFEDDGASFRVRREAFLAREARRGRTMWSKPRNKKDAVLGGLKIGLTIGICVAMIPVFMFLWMVAVWSTSQ
jgi:hypothetical protein